MRGIDDSGKFNQDTITGPFDNATSMFGNLWLPKFTSKHIDTRERTFFISAHKPAVTDDVASKDSSQPPFDPRIGHKDRPGKPSFWAGF